MNKKEVAEMAVIKTKVANIEKTNDKQNVLLDKIDKKLDNHINEIRKNLECKADKIEINMV